MDAFIFFFSVLYCVIIHNQYRHTERQAGMIVSLIVRILY